MGLVREEAEAAVLDKSVGVWLNVSTWTRTESVNKRIFLECRRKILSTHGLIGDTDLGCLRRQPDINETADTQLALIHRAVCLFTLKLSLLLILHTDRDGQAELTQMAD